MIKKGFTLSEVMVTLGILGVLAAFLVPAIMQTTPDNNRVMFKKAYSILEQSVSQMINDDKNYPSDQVNSSYPNIQRGFNYTSKDASITTNKFCYFLSDRLNTVGTISCPLTAATGTGTFTATDGVSWGIYIPISDSTTDSLANSASANTTAVQFPLNLTLYTTKMIIDVNGSKGPNCTADTSGTAAPYSLAACAVTADCSSKPDRFIIGVRYDGKLQIGVTGSSDACANSILQEPTTNH